MITYTDLATRRTRRLRLAARVMRTSLSFVLVFGPPIGRAYAGVIDVRLFGATGDGRTDDGRAIQAAIDAAIKAGVTETVHFGPGTYLFGTGADPGHGSLRIAKANGLTLSGEPGTILRSADPTRNVFDIAGSRNVIIRQLRLERDRLVFSQVLVRSIDPRSKTVVVAIDPGYAPLAAEYVSKAKFLLVFSDPASGTWGDHSQSCAWFSPTDQGVCWPPSITARQRLPDGEWRLTLNTMPQESYVGSHAAVWGGPFKGHAFGIERTDTLLVENVDYLPGGADGGFVLGHSSGSITFRNFTVDVPAASGQLIAAIGGAMVFNNHIHLTLDHVRIARVWDDAINIGANFSRVFSQVGPRVIDVDGSRSDFRVGDVLALWDWSQKSERGRYRIVSVSCGKSAPITCRITLDRDAIIIHAGYAPVKAAHNELDGIDRVISIDSAGTLRVIGSSFQSFHARDLLMRASHSIIEKNEFHDTVAAAIVIGPEFFWDEGPAASDVVIRNNTFRNISGSNILIQNERTSKITIAGNSFLDYGRFNHGIMGDASAPVSVQGVVGASVFNNVFSSHVHGLTSPTQVLNSGKAPTIQDAPSRRRP